MATALLSELESKGFCILDDIFTTDELNGFKKKFTECEREVHKICSQNNPDPYDFVQLFEKENIIKMQSYCNESIIETAKGRYDVRIEKVKEEFKMVPENATIASLMKSCLQTRYLCDIGLLVTGSHANVRH